MVRLQFEEAFNDMVENIDTLIDDKSHHCIPFVLARLELHNVRHAANPHPPPFFLGLNGVQGAGKTMLVSDESFLSPPAVEYVTLA